MEYHEEYNVLKMAELVAGKLKGGLSEEDAALLDKWLQQSPDYQRVYDTILQEYQNESSRRTDAYDTPAALTRVLQRYRAPSSRKKNMIWYAAASILMIFSASIGIYWYNQNNVQQTQLTSIYGDDVLPGGNHATLTLADGSTIKLDSLSLGLIAEQSGMHITKEEDGTITYNTISDGMDATGAVAFNTITTPRGGQYKVVLPDGTQVWLNAASSLKYPTRFSESERIVELEGEGYFDVAHNEKQPFIVKSGQQQVQVLGTQFNIAAYDKDPATTTLVNGSIKVTSNRRDISKVLKPGQQAEITDGQIVVKKVDVRDFISWKDGIVILSQTDLTQVIRQIERWYDVEFEFTDLPKETKLNGVLHRNANLSAILEILELNTEITFKVNERRVIVNK